MAKADPRGGVVRITVFEEPSERTPREGGRAEAGPEAGGRTARVPQAGRIAEPRGYTATGAAADRAGAAELDITATDEKGNPAAAVLYAAAVNSGVARAQRTGS